MIYGGMVISIDAGYAYARTKSRFFSTGCRSLNDNANYDGAHRIILMGGLGLMDGILAAARTMLHIFRQFMDFCAL